MATVQSPQYPEKIDAAVLKIAGVVLLGAIMSILDITVVNVALPSIRQVLFSRAANRSRLLQDQPGPGRRRPRVRQAARGLCGARGQAGLGGRWLPPRRRH